MCFDAPDVPAPDPRMIDLAVKQGDLAEKVANRSMDWMDWSQNRLDNLDDEYRGVQDYLLAEQKKAGARADDEYAYYLGNRGVVDQFLNESKTIDNESALQAVRDRATADVEQAFAGRQAATTRDMQRMGIGPLNGRQLAARGAMDAEGALGKVAAVQSAQDSKKALGLNARANAANVVRGMPATTMGFNGVGQSAGGAAVTTGNAGFGNRTAAFGTGMQGFGTANSGFSGAVNSFGSYTNLQQQAANMQAQNDPTQMLLGGAMRVGAGWAMGGFQMPGKS